MPAVAEEQKYRIRLRASLSGVGWTAERGDAIDMPLADARRLVHRGLAEELKDAPLPKASREEAAAVAVTDVETAGLFPDLDEDGRQRRDRKGQPLFQNSNRVKVRPPQRK